MEFKVNNIIVEFKNFNNENITEDMAKAAVNYAEEHKDVDIAVISRIVVSQDDGKTFFDVEYLDEEQPKIGRIRRITGYLTGTVDRWNSAKRAELHDRTTHIG